MEIADANPMKVLDAVPAFLSVPQNTLSLVVLAQLSLEVVETKLYDIEDGIDTLEDTLEEGSMIFTNTRDAYQYIQEQAFSVPSRFAQASGFTSSTTSGAPSPPATR